jgi:hypothetical protein
MSVWIILLLVVVGLILLGGVVAGLVFLIFWIARNLGGTKGGWRGLTEAYSTTSPPQGQIQKRQTIQIGAVVYKRCVTLGVADEGLYVSFWRRTILIPWSDFTALGQATLYWQKIPMLTVGEPPIATIALPVPVFETMRSKLPVKVVGA